MFQQIRNVTSSLVFPVYFMFVSLSYIPGTIFHLIAKRDFGTLFSPTYLKEAWFARFWGIYGPLIREGRAPFVKPLIAELHGVVLDIGPGAGEWLSLYPKTGITKIYGIEPNKDHHPSLRKKIAENGLQGIYEIIPVGVEKLQDGGWIEEESVDGIVTVLCLCSIPQPKLMIEKLYNLLSPGGKWVVLEHVVVKRNPYVKWYQWTLDFFWPHCLGGCSLTRDTEKSLKETGAWTKVDLAQPADEPSYGVVPHIKGVLVK